MTTIRDFGAIGAFKKLRIQQLAAAVMLTTVFLLALQIYAVQPAYASTSLQVGDYVALAGVPNSAEYDDALLSLKARSSNSKAVSCSTKKPEGYTGKRELFAYARGFGEATVTVSWTLRESLYNERTGKVTQVKRKYFKTFDYSVQEARVKKTACDHIFAGKDYTLSSLFKGMHSVNRISYFSGQTKGVFEAGEGYTASANGKKVRFSSTGSDITVRYRLDGKIYPIHVSVVHSQESLSNKVISQVKKLCYYPSTLKVKSISLRNSKLYVSISAVNLVGVRNSSRVCAYFDHGVFKFEKLS